jgi:hypothetical protein
MANAIGIGTFASVASLPFRVTDPALDAASSPLEAEPEPDPSLEEARLTLARVSAVLERHAGGLTAVQLRAELAEDPATLARGLAEGVRVKQLRRLGARRSMRYLLNP